MRRTSLARCRRIEIEMASSLEMRLKLESRVSHLRSVFERSDASTAHLLCDRHDPSTPAYRIIDASFAARILSYAELADSSVRLASSLSRLGFGPGDRIATLMGKSADYLVTVVAIWRLGAVHVPLFTAFGPPAIAFRLRASGCKLIVCDEAQRGKLVPGEVLPDNASWRILSTGEPRRGDFSFDALLRSGSSTFAALALGGEAPFIEIYTSGTTGTPKGVVVPIRALASFQAYAEFGLDLRADDLFWNAADPGWGYGLYFGVLAALTTGCAGTFLQMSFSPEATLNVLLRLGVTNFAASPTVYRALRSSGLSAEGIRLRCASSAGEPLTPEVNEWALPTLGVTVHDHYGQTEAGMLINNHHHPDLRSPIKAGCMGQVMPGWKAVILKTNADELAAIDEVGRLAMDLTESPFAWFHGYVEDPGRSAEKFAGSGRWYVTGDIARVDAHGNFYFTSRDDDVIIMAGYRIGPLEVESTILRHPAVADCAVIAVPDTIRGEVLEAVVVLRLGLEPSEALTVEIQSLVKTGYAAHAYPRRVHYVATLPRTPSGKVQRYVIRNEIRQAANPA